MLQRCNQCCSAATNAAALQPIPQRCNPSRSAATNAAALRSLQVSSCEALETVCALLGVEAQALTTALTTRKVIRARSSHRAARHRCTRWQRGADPAVSVATSQQTPQSALARKAQTAMRRAAPSMAARLPSAHTSGGRRWRTHARVLSCGSLARQVKAGSEFVTKQLSAEDAADAAAAMAKGLYGRLFCWLVEVRRESS
jgi:hypothetical protein